MAEVAVPERSADHKTTRLQEIALEYVQRYWQRLHPQDRLEIVTSMLTPEERRVLICRWEKEPTP